MMPGIICRSSLPVLIMNDDELTMTLMYTTKGRMKEMKILSFFFFFSQFSFTFRSFSVPRILFVGPFALFVSRSLEHNGRFSFHAYSLCLSSGTPTPYLGLFSNFVPRII